MRVVSCVALAALASFGAAAQSLMNGHGVRPQIVPLFQERGAPSFTVAPSSSGAGLGGLGGGLTPQDPGASNATTSGPAGSAMAALAATGYGDAAQAAAAQAGINVESLAAIGQIESNFRNVGTANGSTSANGFWQITNGTWNDTIARDGLGGTLDRSNPADQATVASNIIRDTAQAVSNATGQPATTLQVYGGYLFGPSYAGGTCDRGREHPAERDHPGGVTDQQWDAKPHGRGFSEPVQRQTRTRRESAGADHGRVIYFPNRAGSCGKCAPHAW